MENKNVDNIEKKILNLLDRPVENKENNSISQKINGFKNNFSSIKGGNTVEFLTKSVIDADIDKKSNVAKNVESLDTRKKYIKNMIESEQWQKIFNMEGERTNRYSDYEIIYSYIPELAACIDAYKDSIIAPDNLIDNNIPIIIEDKVFDPDEVANIEDNLKIIKDKYNLEGLQQKYIRNSLKLGDEFVAVLRYEEEFSNYLLTENDNMMPPEFLDPEGTYQADQKAKFFNETFYTHEIFNDLEKTFLSESAEVSLKGKELEEYKKQVKNSYNNVVNDIKNTMSTINTMDAKDFIKNSSTKEINEAKKSKKINMDKLDVKGCIVKRLEPKYTIKLEVDGLNLGYIYAQRASNQNSSAGNSLVKDFFNSRTSIESDNGKAREDVISNIFMKGIAKKLDLEFIEKNKEYKDLIYILLKNQDFQKKNVNFVYFSPEEVVHFALDKENIYGVSRMAKSLFAAKLYIPSVLNEFMQKVTRGRDKRVVYTEVGLDEAYEESIQSVVRDIKSKEIYTDKLRDLSTVLNTIGNFEDYYIPVFDGEKNIEFDTIQGIKH